MRKRLYLDLLVIFAFISLFVACVATYHAKEVDFKTAAGRTVNTIDSTSVHSVK